MLALVVSYCDFDLPKHLLIAFADRRTESRDGCRGIEIKDAQKVFMLKPFIGLHVAPAHQGIRDADRRGVSELRSDVINIILLQIGIRNVVENIALMIVPVFVGELGRDSFKLIPEGVDANHPSYNNSRSKMEVYEKWIAKTDKEYLLDEYKETVNRWKEISN